MSSENRKLRNRLSQKAFRARQAMRIKELEERVGQEPISNKQLQDANSALRNQLFDVHKKVLSLQISIKSLTTATALALGLNIPNNLSTDNTTRLCSRCQRADDHENEHRSPDEGYSSHTSRPDLEQLDEELGNRTDPQIHTSQILDDNCNVEASNNPLNYRAFSMAESQVEGVAALDNRHITFEPNEGLPQPPTINLDTTDICPTSFRFGSYSSHHCQSGLTADYLSTGPFGRIPRFHISLPFGGRGFGQYGESLSRSSIIDSSAQIPLRRTNSLISDHINAVEYFLRQRWLESSLTTCSQDKFTESIKFMISAFVTVSWQAMTAWHTCTKAHLPLRELTAWRVTRTPEAYAKITPTYRPSKLQMTTQYPAIIDWAPWPSLRDKLITYHSANPGLDSIICDIGNSYCMSTDLSKLITGLPSMIGYLSVWDLVRAIAPDATRPNGDSFALGSISSIDDNHHNLEPNNNFLHSKGGNNHGADAIRNVMSDGSYGYANEDEVSSSSRFTLPAPDAQSLFNNKSLAMEAFKILGMDKGASNFCLDPEFFTRHPELYDPECNIMARGVPLRPNSHWSFPIPRDLNASVVAQYKEFAKWSFNGSVEGE